MRAHIETLNERQQQGTKTKRYRTYCQDIDDAAAAVIPILYKLLFGYYCIFLIPLMLLFNFQQFYKQCENQYCFSPRSKWHSFKKRPPLL